MPIIIYWKHSTYVENTSHGLAYHFSSNQKRLHSCTSIGDDVFIVSVVRDGNNADVYLLAHLVVDAQEVNPPDSEYGSYKIYGNTSKSRYFSLEAQPLTPVLSKMNSIKPLPEHEKHKYAQAFQTIREISHADVHLLKAFADTLPLHHASTQDGDNINKKHSNGHFVMPSGREVFLVRLHMSLTYDGCMEGGRASNSHYIRKRLVADIQEEFAGNQKVVCIDKGNQVLPDFRWIAEFASNGGVKTDDSDYNSQLCICWFNDILPSDLHTFLNEVLVTINWEEEAEDYSIML